MLGALHGARSGRVRVDGRSLGVVGREADYRAITRRCSRMTPAGRQGAPRLSAAGGGLRQHACRLLTADLADVFFVLEHDAQRLVDEFGLELTGTE